MENVSDYKKRLKSIVNSLQKSVECPVCLETLKPSFKVCVRGHGVCLECMTKLEKCPLCQESFILENLICIKSVLEALPHLCCYSNAGCEDVVEPGNDHEMFCGYRPIICRIKGCSVKMPVVKIVDHERDHYPVLFRSVHYNKSETLRWGITPEIKAHRYVPLYLFNNLFWILMINDVTEKQLKFFFQATPIGKLENDYYVTLTFQKEKFVYVYTLKAQVLSSCERKFEGKEDIRSELIESCDEEYCMRIPQRELSKFINDRGELLIRYDFFKDVEDEEEINSQKGSDSEEDD